MIQHFNFHVTSPDFKLLSLYFKTKKKQPVLWFQRVCIWHQTVVSFPQVKVWNTNSGLCFVTFTEHTSSVTNVTFTSSGFVIVSASLDGTVRAFDLHRWTYSEAGSLPKFDRDGEWAWGCNIWICNLAAYVWRCLCLHLFITDTETSGRSRCFVLRSSPPSQ